MERTLFWRVTGARQQQAVRSGRWKLVVDQARPLLFDLSTDIGERTDVIRQHVDVATQAAGGADRLAGRRRCRGEGCRVAVTPDRPSPSPA